MKRKRFLSALLAMVMIISLTVIHVYAQPTTYTLNIVDIDGIPLDFKVNGDTGIQISRYSGTDLFPDWPAYNLILNCPSYGNADSDYEDADCFAAKLTVGKGNVFDGCVVYHNADKG